MPKGDVMSEILKKQQRVSLIVLVLEALGILAVTFCYFYYPSSESYYFIAIGLMALYVILDAALAYFFNFRVGKVKSKTELTSAMIIGADVNEAYNFGQIGIAVCDHANTVMWTNDFLSMRFNNLVDHNIFEILPGLSSLTNKTGKKDVVKITYESHVYNVELLEEAHLYVFKDVTDFENADMTNKNQSPVVGYIAIDNYADVQMATAEETVFADMLAKTRSLINGFASASSSLIRRIRDDRYLFITKNENYQKILKDKFSIVDRVRNSFPGGNGFTLSIGVSYGFDDYAKLAEMASSALDVALSRGGDQTVIAPFSQPMIYFGGKRELQPTRNRVKVRTLSNSFITILRNYRNVIIMGHTIADFDAIGAALGVHLLCQYINVPSSICWEDQLIEDKCRLAVLREFSREEMNSIFVGLKDVHSLIHEDTLLVLVDNNDPTRVIFPGIVRDFKDVAIIDHHRPGVNQLTDTVYTNIDSSASSTAEILTSYITYNANNIPLDKRTATFLLAGICLDTGSFKEHATVSTFEAASQLKNYNADSEKVYDFLKEDFEEYRQKISILNNAETPFYGALIATSPDHDILSSVTLSQVANQAIAIRGIFCAFCIGRTSEHEVKISARSDGSVNCQMLMEKLGGGGRFTMAATAFNDIKVDEVKDKLKSVLNDYLEEAKVKNTEDSSQQE